MWYIREYWRTGRVILLLYLAAVLVGIILGVLGGISISSSFDDYTQVNNYTISWYIGSKQTFGSLFGSGILDALICSLVILLFNVSVWLIAGNFLLVIFKGYILSYNAVVMISSLGIGGFFQITFIFIPQQLLLCALIVFLSTIAYKRCAYYRGCGLFCCRGVGYDTLIKKMVIALLVFCALNLLFCILFAITAGKLVL